MINKRKNIQCGIVNVILTALFLILYYCKFFLPINTKYTNLCLIIVGWLALVFVLLKQSGLSKKISFLLLADVIALVGMLYNKNYSIPYWLLAVAFQGEALAVIYCPKNVRKGLFKLFVLCFWLFVAMLTANMIIGKSTNAFFNKASENFISIMLLSLFFLYTYYIFTYKNNKNLRVFVVWLICLLFSIYSNGRMGTLVFAFFGLFYFASLIYGKTKHKYLFVFLLLVFTCCVLMMIVNRFKSTFEDVFSSEGRFYLWNAYFEETKKGGLLSFVFGTSFTNNKLFLQWNKNMHNSFLQIHMMYGIMPCLIIMLSSVIFLFKGKNRTIKLLLVCLLLRSITDSFLIGELCDIPMYMVIFSLYSHISMRSVLFPKKYIMEAC